MCVIAPNWCSPHEKLILYFKEDVMDINKNITAVREEAI